jgi:serine/threonine protein kinase
LRSKDNEINIGIVDFGLSTYVNAKKYIYRRCGTPGFMAP